MLGMLFVDEKGILGLCGYGNGPHGNDRRGISLVHIDDT